MKKKKSKKKSLGTVVWRWIEEHEALVLILLVMAVLRIPSLFEPGGGDEQIYLAFSTASRKGAAFYRDIFDHKPPLIYVMAGLAGNITLFKFLLLVWSLAGVGVVWSLAQKLWQKPASSVVATGLYGLLTTIPLLEGNSVNAELFMIVPAIMGVLWLLKEKKKWWEHLGVGLLFGFALLFKVPIGTDFVAVMLWLFIYKKFAWRNLIIWVVDKRWWLMMAGFLLPITVSFAYFALVGSLTPYLQAVAGFNVGYVAAWEGGRQPLWQSGLFQRGVILAAWLLGVLASRKYWGEKMTLLLIWFALAMFGVTLPGRPYPHYWIQVVAPMALLVGALWVEWRKALVGIVMGGLIIGLGVWKYQVWHYSTINYYQNFVEGISGRKSSDEYLDYFGGEVRRNRLVAEYVRMRTGSEDKMFVWGTEPSIYVEAKRAPVGRYTVAFHIKDFGAYDEILEALKKEEPKFIVIMEYEDRWDDLMEYMNGQYLEVEVIEGAHIWRRVFD